MKSILYLLFLTLFILLSRLSYSQEVKAPRLVVGIVVDQMRYDFLLRYSEKYTEGGFKKLLREGYSCNNMHFNYVPTYTAPGHASVFTGTTPAIHGVIGNEWFNINKGRKIYCVYDSAVTVTGPGNDGERMSPANLISPTITDELKNATNGKAKVIGIALKDRGSVLPAGHKADAAYWFDHHTGNWVSSSYYLKKLPNWVNNFNARKDPNKYLSSAWNTLLPINQYTESTADDTPYEEKFEKEEKPVFPHDLPSLRKEDFDLLKSTPWGNTLTKDFAIATIKSEGLGKDSVTDFLTISFSSTDIIGHQFGPNSIEVEDTYLRLDRDLRDLLSFLDSSFLSENILVFLTADHGVTEVPQYLKDHNEDAGVFNVKGLLEGAYGLLGKKYGEGRFILQYINQQFYLDKKLLLEKKIPLKEVKKTLIEYARGFEGVMEAYSSEEILSSFNSGFPINLVKAGFNQERSGDVVLVLKPHWMEGKKRGTSHGSPFEYDTHVPFILYGNRIKPGIKEEKVVIPDIAPTVAKIMGIPAPSDCSGKAILLK